MLESVIEGVPSYGNMEGLLDFVARLTPSSDREQNLLYHEYNNTNNPYSVRYIAGIKILGTVGKNKIDKWAKELEKDIFGNIPQIDKLDLVKDVAKLFELSRAESVKNLLAKIYKHPLNEPELRQIAGEALGYNRIKMEFNIRTERFCEISVVGTITLGATSYTAYQLAAYFSR